MVCRLLDNYTKMLFLRQIAEKLRAIIAYTLPFLLALILLSFPTSARADTLQYVSMQSDGDSTGWSAFSNVSGDFSLRCYAGNFPDISTFIGGFQILTGWSNPPVFNDELGWETTNTGNAYNLGITTDGNYWCGFNELGGSTSYYGYQFYVSATRSGGVWTSSVYNTATRILSVTPLDGSTISTSTTATIGANVFVNADQFNASEYLEVSILRNQDNQANANPQLLTTTFDFPIASGGENDFTTTTPLTITGVYTLTAQLRQSSLTQNVLNFFGFGELGAFFANSTLLSTTTSFTLGAPTAFDIFNASTTEALNAFVASSTLSLGVCSNWTQFNLLDCLSLVFTYQPSPMLTEFSTLQKTLFSYAPWGYVTRTMAILTSGATTSVPAIGFSFPSDFPVPLLAGFSMNFDPWNYFNFYQNFKSDPSTGTPEDAWEIISPIFTSVCWLWTAWLIFSDLLGIDAGGHGSNGGGGVRIRRERGTITYDRNHTNDIGI